VTKTTAVPPSIDIAQAAQKKPILEIAKAIGIKPEELMLYGNYKAKVALTVRDRLAGRPNGKLVAVTAITPTPLGEGKTTTTIGLCQALGAHLGKRVITCIRQPSMGPLFGIKGGAAGGGYSQVIPMEDFNLHLTGDIHAVSQAHNLLAAAIDSRMLYEAKHANDEDLVKALCRVDSSGERVFGPVFERRRDRLGIRAATLDALSAAERRAIFRLDIDPETITWNRVVDNNDKMLRQIQIGLGPEEQFPRTTGFDIAVASELMAILALSTSLEDMRNRFSRIVIGMSRSGVPVTADDIGVTGALTVTMKDALMPTLMQTLEGTPVFVHAGPFANIAHGNSSVVADQIALKLADYVVTEAGFGSDIGFEKFANIKCRSGGFAPDCAVLVTTIRALKMHGGGPKVVAGKPLDKAYTEENLALVEAGLPNLERHIANVRQYGIPVVVAINTFDSDSDAEVALVERAAVRGGAHSAAKSSHFADGGVGAVALGNAVIAACATPAQFKPLYQLSESITEKIERIAQSYGASGVDYLPAAQKKIDLYTQLGYGNLPICVAKTHLSFSDDQNAKNAPTGFRMTVREMRLSAGAGFLYPLMGTMRTMPGLPPRPAFFDIDIDPLSGKISGMY